MLSPVLHGCIVCGCSRWQIRLSGCIIPKYCANSIIWLHYTEILRKPIYPILNSYLGGADMIEVQGLSLTISKTEILKHIDIRFESGKIHGLIGRNGSGKTMLMKCICGFIRPTAGIVIVAGKQTYIFWKWRILLSVLYRWQDWIYRISPCYSHFIFRKRWTSFCYCRNEM